MRLLLPTLIDRLGPTPTAEQIGNTIASLAATPDPSHDAYQLTTNGPVPIG